LRHSLKRAKTRSSQSCFCASGSAQGLFEGLKVKVAQEPKQGVGVWQGVDLREQQLQGRARRKQFAEKAARPL